mmetsp:Transcript_26429/g.66446  ORF Transcript_26429/g.66446 Transcript_26429/m.66446 type:complete len:268 (+) Transcript_26429:1010-1813(+)
MPVSIQLPRGSSPHFSRRCPPLTCPRYLRARCLRCSSTPTTPSRSTSLRPTLRIWAQPGTPSCSYPRSPGPPPHGPPSPSHWAARMSPWMSWSTAASGASLPSRASTPQSTARRCRVPTCARRRTPAPCWSSSWRSRPSFGCPTSRRACGWMRKPMCCTCQLCSSGTAWTLYRPALRTTPASTGKACVTTSLPATSAPHSWSTTGRSTPRPPPLSRMTPSQLPPSTATLRPPLRPSLARSLALAAEVRVVFRYQHIDAGTVSWSPAS